MSSEARAMLEARRVEMALLPTAFEMSHLEAVPLFEEKFYLFGQKKLFAGEGSGPIAFKDIGDRPLVAPDRDHDLRKLIERAALDQKSTLNIRYELNSSVLLRRAVIEGLGFGIMPRNTYSPAEARGLMAREIVKPRMERTQSLAWLIDQPLSPAGEMVKSTLIALVARMVRKGTFKARLLA
jgi:LysR family nitrogen assimilation transcriptional regulator